MSYEVMKEEVDPCRCGRGTIIFRFEMDDWNRCRRSFETTCPECRREDELRLQEKQRAQELKRQRTEEARELARQRYLDKWLALFADCTVRDAWFRFTGGERYPSLGTFYKHVKQSGGLLENMRWQFNSDVLHALQLLDIQDEEISLLLDVGGYSEQDTPII